MPKRKKKKKRSLKKDGRELRITSATKGTSTRVSWTIRGVCKAKVI